MLTTYRAMREVLPHVAIASDCYHITALINHAIEVPLRREQRRELDHLGQQTLKGNRFLLLSNYKDLKPDRKAQLDALLEVKQPLLQSGPESGIWPESEKPWLRTGRVAQLSQGHPAKEYLRCFSRKGSMTSQRHSRKITTSFPQKAGIQSPACQAQISSYSPPDIALLHPSCLLGSLPSLATVPPCDN